MIGPFWPFLNKRQSERLVTSSPRRHGRYQGWKHGKIVGNLHGILWHHVQKNKLGVVFGAKPVSGSAVNRTRSAPDVAFIARDNLPEKEPVEAYWPGRPDLAVEVLSPDDRPREVEEKTKTCLAAGTKMVWVVDPKLRGVSLYRSPTDVVVKTGADVLDGGNVVAGFRCPPAEIFGLPA